MPPFLQVVAWSSVANMTAALTKPALSRLLRPVSFINDVPHQDLQPALCASPGREYISILQVLHHTKEDVSMLKRQRSGAAQIPARRRPACLPRAELPEAG